ncbi:MAG: hypothetical protein A2Y15_05340 [Clostridiales bacterium GWF2_36_10]|nr:MAG: hypothetical protein A2Y15_05340 [Clostridiales bacterium GWF2_36_10]HAN20088.1 hypothetical protein [Clostridiales bacterium]
MTNNNYNQKNRHWMKLDNAAKIFPAAMSRGWMSMFRLSAELTEPVDIEVLQKAQIRTVKRFPSISLRLRKGVFWYYLEHIEAEPPLYEDAANPCIRINFKQNNGYMFRVRYHDTKIALEFFHVLTDGTGGLCFLKTLVAEYLTLKYGICIPRSDSILDCNEAPKLEETEDSYIKYARDVKVSRISEAAYHLSGTSEDKDFMHITTALLSASEVISKAKSYNVTVTEYILANLIMAIYDAQKAEIDIKHRKPIVICVPVNLRKYYPTSTMRNFAGIVNIGISPKFGDYTFEETLKVVKHQMGLQTSEKMMNAWMTTNVSTEKNTFMRVAPLFIKNPTMKIAYGFNADRASSTTLSNLGNIKLPEEMACFVTRFDFMLGSSKKNPAVCGCITYNDLMSINITRQIKEPTLEHNFYTRLVMQGIHVKIESNQRY